MAIGETSFRCLMRCLPPLLSISIFAAVLAAPIPSHRSGYSTFREDLAGLSVFVDGYPASLGVDDAYVPVPVAIALMRTGTSIAFAPESFTLEDAKGNRVPAAGFVEVRNGHPRLAFDRALVLAQPIAVGTTLTDRPRIASLFYPPEGAGTRIPRVELAPFSWFTDVIYFPRPPAGLDGLMTLSVAVAGGDPVDVKFFMSTDGLAKR